MGRPKKEFFTETIKEQSTVGLEEHIPTGVVKEEVKTDDYNIEIIKDYHGAIDPFYLSKKDPNYEYRFLRADDANLSLKTGNLLFQKGGWQLCGRTHLEKIGIQERFISPDGFYRVGQNILAFMPKSLFIEKSADKKKKADFPMGAVTRMMKEGDRSVGGIHETMKGLQTAEQLGFATKKD